MMQHLHEFDDKKFQNASKEDLKFGDKDDKVRHGLLCFIHSFQIKLRTHN